MLINEPDNFYRSVIQLRIIFAVAISLLAYNSGICQDSLQIKLSLQDALKLAMEKNLILKTADLKTKQSELQLRSSTEIGPTEFYFRNGNLYGNENASYFELNQNFGPILKHIQCKKAAKTNTQLQTLSHNIIELEVKALVKSAYILWQHKYKISEINFDENELYSELISIAEAKYKTGEISLLQKAKLFTKASEVKSRFLMSTDELVIAENKLKQVMYCEGNFIPSSIEPEIYSIDRSATIANYNGSVYLDYHSTLQLLAEQEVDIKKSEYFPEIKAGGFAQNIDNKGDYFGWQIGITVPLWPSKQNSNVKQALINSDIAKIEYEQQKQAIAFETNNLLFELNKYFRQIRHFEETALDEAEIIINTASTQLETEEIEYTEFLESISSAYQIKRLYYEALHNYNQTAIQLEIYAE